MEFLYSEIREGFLPLFDGVIDHFTKGWNEKWHKELVLVLVVDLISGLIFVLVM